MALFNLNSSSYMKNQRWKAVQEAIYTLATNLQQYSVYLDSHREMSKQNSSRMTVQTEVDEIAVIAHCESVTPIRYDALYKAIENKAPFEPVFINEHALPDARRRYDYIKGLVVPFKCVKYTYTGSSNHLHFIWRIRPESTETETMNECLKVRDGLKKLFPVYHSRAMKHEFVHLFRKLTHCKSAFLREIYRRLTGDCSASSNVAEKEVDMRLNQLIEDEDPDLIWDLRLNNDGRPEMYSTFLDFCRKYIDSQVETAVDDRRHDAVVESDVVTHLATAMSVRDFHDQVIKMCPNGTPIPSIQWLCQQFWPRRLNCGFAKHQKGRLLIKFMVQARQFRKKHVDCHYASALYRYLREFTILYHDYSTLVSMDDKHVVKVGEPGYPVAGIERGKQVLVAPGKKFAVGDHDFTKFSMSPSVSFLIDIPENITDSFYSGRVFVGLKENAFQKSSPIRHATELEGILKSSVVSPVLLLYTDSGPDHRLTYVSVQISLISIFCFIES